MRPHHSAFKVSVIIPARNSESVLGICLEALHVSSHPIHEIIVVNDGSSDDTPLLQNSGA